jgi:hypothetical protein
MRGIGFDAAGHPEISFEIWKNHLPNSGFISRKKKTPFFPP